MGSAIEGGIQGSTYASDTGPSIGTGDTRSQASGVPGITARSKEQVKRVTGVTRDALYHRVDNKKHDIVRGLRGFASTLEDASRDNEGIARQVLDGTVDYVRRASERLENDTTEELLQQAGDKIRERPGIFFFSCVAVGFFATRFLKL